MEPRRPPARPSASQPVRALPVARRPGEPFNPVGLFNGIFIPEAICKYRGLPLGAKMVYGRLCRYAGRDGAVYPALSTLASELGIGKTQARTYVMELERKLFIAVDRKNRHFFPNGTGGSNRYVFLWHAAFEGEQGDFRKAPPVRKTGGVPLRKTEPLPLRKTGGKENHHQESQKKESPFSANAKTPSHAPKNPNPGVVFPEDDEKPPEASVSLPPWDALRAEFRTAKGGMEMSFQDESWLKEQMERRQIAPESLLELVRENQLRGFQSPMAGLKWLIKKFRLKTKSSAVLEAAATVAVGRMSPPAEVPRCERCGGAGRVLERIEGSRPKMTDQYCDCRLGKELEAVESRPRTAEEPAAAQHGRVESRRDVC